MFYRAVISFLLIFLYFNQEILAAKTLSRQRRCIVIQKQSGTHGDSSEDGGEEDYRRPEPKDPRPDKLTKRVTDVADKYDQDVENVTPELLKFKIMPMKRTGNENLQLKRRFLKRYLGI